MHERHNFAQVPRFRAGLLLKVLTRPDYEIAFHLCIPPRSSEQNLGGEGVRSIRRTLSAKSNFGSDGLLELDALTGSHSHFDVDASSSIWFIADWPLGASHDDVSCLKKVCSIDNGFTNPSSSI
ncbi:hypothetical protein EIP91_010267 [Steccherinum ochraceum]|uniref:Uncharacterized protein n=1 Tax=Steccherinum ochraceum TaxID=92696 RepID=A0A4R0RN48_9APHY|nr:hypothetical protein EIP91_010267 [Steccherinum ochraceum]